MDPLSVLSDPDTVCQSEYRAIYDCIRDALQDAPEDERLEIALAMLKEFKDSAKSMRKTLKGFSKKSGERRK